MKISVGFFGNVKINENYKNIKKILKNYIRKIKMDI